MSDAGFGTGTKFDTMWESREKICLVADEVFAVDLDRQVAC